MTQETKRAAGFARRVIEAHAPSVDDNPVRIRMPSVRQVQEANAKFPDDATKLAMWLLAQCVLGPDGEPIGEEGVGELSFLGLQELADALELDLDGHGVVFSIVFTGGRSRAALRGARRSSHPDGQSAGGREGPAADIARLV